MSTTTRSFEAKHWATMGLIFSFATILAGILVLTLGGDGTLEMSEKTRVGVGSTCISLGVVAVAIAVGIFYKYMDRRNRNNHQSAVQGDEENTTNTASPPSNPYERHPPPRTAKPQATGAAQELGTTSHRVPAGATAGTTVGPAESYELQDMTPQRDGIQEACNQIAQAAEILESFTFTPPTRPPPSPPTVPAKPIGLTRARSPLAKYPPLRYSSATSTASVKDEEATEKEQADVNVPIKTDMSILKPPQSSNDPVEGRHVRFIEPLAASSSILDLASSKETFESIPLDTPASPSPPNNLSYQTYKIENGKISDLESGQEVEVHGLSKLGKSFGVARKAQQTFKVGNGMVLDVNSLESAILRGGSLRASLEGEVSKSKEFLKNWRSTGSLRALLKNPGSVTRASETEFV